MKKLAILSTLVLFVLSFDQLHAQQKKQQVAQEIKGEIKTDKSEIKTEKKAIRSEREELHKLDVGAVSDMAKNAFYADFGNVPNVNWKRTDYFDEATFMKNGKEMKAYYDDKSQLVGTSTFKTFADIPKNAQKEIKKRYKDYSIGEVVYYDDNENNDTDMLLYGTQFADADNYFVSLKKGDKTLILQVDPQGEIFFFKEI